MDPATLKLAKKKSPVFQCTHKDCSEHGDRVTMVRHVLLKHTAKVKSGLKVDFWTKSPNGNLL